MSKGDNAMAHLLVKQVVKDFDAWLEQFKKNVPMRQQWGSQAATVFRNPGDPHEVLIFFQWDSMENVTRFAKSQELLDVLEEANSGIPLILDEAYDTEG